jgi:hypothetical protein
MTRRRGGLVNAPPKQTVLSAGSLYGSAASTRAGSGATGAKVRLWVLLDEDYSGRLVAYRRLGRGLERTDLGPIDRWVARPPVGRALAKWEVYLASGEVVTANAAPCVCGAGKVGYAGPVDEPHMIETVRGSLLEWLET